MTSEQQPKSGVRARDPFPKRRPTQRWKRSAIEHGVDRARAVFVERFDCKLESALELACDEQRVGVFFCRRMIFQRIVIDETCASTSLRLNFICDDRVEPRQTRSTRSELARARKNLEQRVLRDVVRVGFSEPTTRKADGPRSKCEVERLERRPIATRELGHQPIELRFAHHRRSRHRATASPCDARSKPRPDGSTENRARSNRPPYIDERRIRPRSRSRRARREQVE